MSLFIPDKYSIDWGFNYSFLPKSYKSTKYYSRSMFFINYTRFDV